MKVLRVLGLLLIIFSIAFNADVIHARKIKNTLKIEKNSVLKNEKTIEEEGKEVALSDTTLHITFSGYDKEPNSSKESFIISNFTDDTITNFEVKIVYTDMKGRMFHSRTIKENCDIPPSESRRFDIKTWDTQHTYYYHLGNEPKKVATPFDVKFDLIAVRLK